MRYKQLAAALLVVCSIVASAVAKEVVVVLDPNVRPYVEAVAGFKQVSNMTIKVFNRRDDGDLSDERALIAAIRARKPDQILVLGSEAMTALAGEITDIPILFSMVLSPQDTWKNKPKNLTGVTMSVPPQRQMQVLATLFPDLKFVTSVYSPDQNTLLLRQGEEACSALHMKLITAQAGSTTEAIVQVEKLLASHEVYWMLPDQLMRSRDVIRYLFFTAREKQKVLIGLSDKYVRAGALFAFTVQNEALGRQVAALSNRMLAEGSRGNYPVEMAHEADLSINMKVAKNLGISVPDALLAQARVLY